MQIAIEGPEMKFVDFNQDVVFKNRRNILWAYYFLLLYAFLYKTVFSPQILGEEKEGGHLSPLPPLQPFPLPMFPYY